jgi:cytochrome c biogenesis protein CcdA
MNLQREGLLMALLTFNLGVEIGQLLIVAVFWPALQQLARTRHRDLIVRLASVVILIFGTLWLVERLKWL